MYLGMRRGIESIKSIGYRLWLYLNEELLLKGMLVADNEPALSEKDLSLVNQVDRAHREWEQARAFFNEAADPDLIDHAIYAIEAAERKYIYLLKLARKENKIDDSLYRFRQNGLA